MLRFNELIFHILLTAAAETHRQKMAASFDQRVVVGEEMSVGNNDFNSNSNSMSTPRKPGRDLQHYQGKSREVITSLLCLKI